MNKLFILLLLTGCGKNISDFLNKDDEPYKVSNTDPIFNKYVESFERNFKVKVNVPIVFKPIDNMYAGVCYTWTNYREVNINKSLWKHFTEEQKEQLIFHELGHCVGDLPHDNVHVNNCPKSVMRSFMFSEFEIANCYLPNKNSYINELYNKLF
jgi:hypothetical protein